MNYLNYKKPVSRVLHTWLIVFWRGGKKNEVCILKGHVCIIQRNPRKRLYFELTSSVRLFFLLWPEYFAQFMFFFFSSLFSYGDHYEWNKAVTCIHNVFSQHRWLEHYCDIVIRDFNNDECTCKITFVKVCFSCFCISSLNLIIESLFTHSGDVSMLYDLLSFSDHKRCLHSMSWKLIVTSFKR